MQETSAIKKVTIRIFLMILSVCLVLSGLTIPIAVNAATPKNFLDGKKYEFEKSDDYKFSSGTQYTSTSTSATYGQFSVWGSDAPLVETGNKNGVPAYSVENGSISIAYSYANRMANAVESEWHVISDKEKNIDVFKLDSNIQNGALILQRSIDHINWNNISVQTNVFENTPIQNAPLYECLDVELINGCYYRLIVAYELSRLADSSKVLWVFTDNDYEYKRVAEVYEFYAKVDNEHIENLQSNTKKYRLGETVKVADFASYSGKKEITKSDLHYNWKLGDFFVSGYSDTRENGKTVFLKNVGDVVTLWFKLSQNINAINNDSKLSITSDDDGFDQYFQTDATNFGRGMLIIRYTDCENVTHEPVMYYDFLEANTSLGANTRVQLFEEGDYEVALDYEVTKDQVVDKVEHYRTFFEFSVRNANCMVYPFDVKTGEELTNSSVTKNGFYLDLARSRYLKIYIEKEVWHEGADGLVKDIRFNTAAKDGDKYIDEGIYTITVENQYTGLKTTKTIYVGTNRILLAYMTTNYSLSEIQDLVSKGAIIYEDGSIEMPPETYSVSHEFVSGTLGKVLPSEVLCFIPQNQTNKEDGMEVAPGKVEVTEVVVEDGTWFFQGWDAAKKVIDASNLRFTGIWIFESNAVEETQIEAMPTEEILPVDETVSTSNTGTSPEETIVETTTSEKDETTNPTEDFIQVSSIAVEDTEPESRSSTGLIVATISIAIGLACWWFFRKGRKEV